MKGLYMIKFFANFWHMNWSGFRRGWSQGMSNNGALRRMRRSGS